MNILIIYRHFWPDSPPYASMLRSIAGRLSADGHQVTIWAEMPCYKLSDGALDPAPSERLQGAEIKRFGRLPGWHRFAPVRLIDKLAFLPRILLRALAARGGGQRFDLVWTATIPPVAQGLVGRIVAAMLGARLLYHCQDLYPELAIHSGLWRKGSLAARIATAVERKTRARADWLVTLSHDMEDTAIRLAAPRRLAVINNFMLEDFGAFDTGEASTPYTHEGDEIVIGFAGNLGRFQGLEQIVEAMRLLGPDGGIRLEFLGDGKAKPKLEALAAGLDHVRFAPHLPFAEAKTRIAAFDLGLVSVEPDIYRYAYPSKTLTYLGLGVPVLAVIEPESELARMIGAEDVGFVAAGRDPAAIAQTMRTIAGRRAALPAMRGAALTLYREKLSRGARLDQWSQLLGAVSSSSGTKT